MLDPGTKYDTEIMWCDISGPNRTLEFAAQFYNHALARGRQVTMNTPTRSMRSASPCELAWAATVADGIYEPIAE
ncbi:hypothetical protein DFH09DRAFT_1360678 [Mycena vulgaris]|nr:hypothetical protein DFH09DRAFT_1360678 [Mycena vulgaris]